MRHVLGMSTSKSLLITASAGLASLSLACASQKPRSNQEVENLIALSRESNAALLQGDAERYANMVALTDDFTLMSPFGGAPSHGNPTKERWQQIGKFFKNGALQVEVVQSYRSDGMVVLALIERANVEVGELPAQDWALRVTLVYRREDNAWRLVHRHADPLAHGVSVPRAAALARGERPEEG